MLAGFFEGIVHDRKLMERPQTDLAFRWFAGFALHERVPDHSSLTRIRLRWGTERFRRIFVKSVEACIAAVMNLKRLARALTLSTDALVPRIAPEEPLAPLRNAVGRLGRLARANPALSGTVACPEIGDSHLFFLC
jgi:hypothetical protein